MEKRLTMFLACLFLFMGEVLAQTRVTGTVISAEDDQPIIGASVIVQGQRSGTVTDADGRFTISVPAGKKLTISYIGMDTEVVTPRNGMRVVLRNSAELEEVVVTGMQKVDKRLFTGATTRISGEEAKLDGVADVARSLEGRAAGVSVQNVSGTFGTAPKIRVRGAPDADQRGPEHPQAQVFHPADPHKGVARSARSTGRIPERCPDRSQKKTARRFRRALYCFIS